MSLDMTVISAWAAVIAAIAAVAALWWQSRLTKLTLGLEHLSKLEDQFRDSERMLKARSKAATSILEEKVDDELDEVLDFFESLAFLVRKGIFDLDMVRWNFSYWIVRYWLASRNYIVERREALNEPFLWNDFEKLHNSIVTLMCRQRGLESDKFSISEEELNRFLREESELLETEA